MLITFQTLGAVVWNGFCLPLPAILSPLAKTVTYNWSQSEAKPKRLGFVIRCKSRSKPPGFVPIELKTKFFDARR